MIPKGVGAPPPPGMDPRKGKLMCIKVRMLDDTVGVFHLGHKALGEALFNEVCRHLNLLETDYFGLEFNDCFNNRCWLDKDKPILRQITNKQSDARFAFVVKFYTPNPADLEEEYTRYLLALQIRRDLATGELRCNYNTAALMAAHIVQSDCGDFSAEDYPDHTYLNSGRFIPNQSVDFLKVVRENHMKLMGMSPGESDLALLEIARRCEFYGVKLHEAKDVEDTIIGLSVAHMGIRVFHQMQCVSTFSWAKIRKLSFKRRKMLIKLHPESYQYYKETIEFSFENRNECKNFWKKCVEHHAFFRCLEVTVPKKSKEGKLFSRGSSFRYHGKTQKQLIDYVREHRKRREPFSRPIKSSLSSQQGLYSKPARYVSAGYSTVSERTIKTIPGFSMQKLQANDSQPCCSYVNEKNYHLSHPGTLRTSNLRSTRSELTNKVHSHLIAQKHSSGAVSDGEYIYSSDIEPNHYCTAPSRYKQNLSLKQLVENNEEKNSKETDSHDPLISLSLPNVLGEDVHLVCKELKLNCDGPPKSVSGDNFLEMQQTSQEIDNISEGSYRISDNEPHSLHSTSSRQTDAPQAILDIHYEENAERSERESKGKAVYTNDHKTTAALASPKQIVGISYSSEGKIRTESCPRNIEEMDREVPEKHFSTSAPSAFFMQKDLPSSIKNDTLIKKRSLDLEDKQRRRDVATQDSEYEISTATVRSKEHPIEQNVLKRFPVAQQFPQKAAISPLVSSSSKAQIIYTSRGTILQKPKVIYDESEDKACTNMKEKTSSGSDKLIAQSQPTPKTYGATGPLPGKIITRENIVIAADSVKKPKPAVPPKPKHLSDLIATQQSQNSATLAPSHAIVNLQEEEISSALQSSAPRPTTLSSQRPTIISIQSEDAPDIQKCHLLNSEIPYVLTVRKITTDNENKSETPFSTFKDPTGTQALSDAISGAETPTLERDKSRSPDLFGRRKSLDLVQRKRLPSPGSFSSQDHSVSPTSLDSGDVLEYLLRRRSASNERSSLAKRGKRGDLRRQTQPVRFNLPPSPDVEQQRSSSISQPNLQDDNDDEFSSHDEKVEDDGSNAESKSPADSQETMDKPGPISPQSLCDEEVFPPLPDVASASNSGITEFVTLEEHLPLPPSTPPLPPPPSVLTDAQTARSTGTVEFSQNDAPVTTEGAPLDESVPFADESVSPSSSLVQNEDSSESQQQSQSSATLRTPTGLLWTDF